LVGPERISGWAVGIIVRHIPVQTPLPYIACHIIKSIGVGSVLSHRGHPVMTILEGILVWEITLPDIGMPLVARGEFIAPNK
jgi:hypothetical protein